MNGTINNYCFILKIVCTSFNLNTFIIPMVINHKCNIFY